MQNSLHSIRISLKQWKPRKVKHPIINTVSWTGTLSYWKLPWNINLSHFHHDKSWHLSSSSASSKISLNLVTGCQWEMEAHVSFYPPSEVRGFPWTLHAFLSSGSASGLPLMACLPHTLARCELLKDGSLVFSKPSGVQQSLQKYFFNKCSSQQ